MNTTVEQTNTNFHMLAKPSGPICNLDCHYCFYTEKEALFKPKTPFRMSEETLENFIKNYIQAQNAAEIPFVWQGGEPTLLGLNFYKKAVEFQKKYANGKTISNSLQTNGTLLTDEWFPFLAENNFLVGLSLDGPEEIHDEIRGGVAENAVGQDSATVPEGKGNGSRRRRYFNDGRLNFTAETQRAQSYYRRFGLLIP